MTRETWQTVRRLARVIVPLVLLGAIAFSGLAPATRLMGLLFMALICTVALVYEMSQHEASPGAMLAGVAGIIVLAIGAHGVLAVTWLPDSAQGPLLAASEPTPENICQPFKPGPEKLVVLSGKDAVIGPGDRAFIPIQVAACSALTLERNATGLMVNATGYDRSASLAWQLHDNRFEEFLDQKLYLRRPDASTLKVLNLHGDEILYVRYLNPGTVRVRGRFICEGSQTITIRDSGTLLGRHPALRPICATAKPPGYGIEYTRRGD